MSIVSNYARVTEDQLKQLRSLPERIEGIDQVCDEDAVIDLDKAAEVISWLLSPYKRAEQHRSKAGNEYSMNRIPIDESTIPPLPPMDDYIIRNRRSQASLGINTGTETSLCLRFRAEAGETFFQSLGEGRRG